MTTGCSHACHGKRAWLRGDMSFLWTMWYIHTATKTSFLVVRSRSFACPLLDIPHQRIFARVPPLIVVLPTIPSPRYNPSEVVWPALLLGPRRGVVAGGMGLELRLVGVDDLAAAVLALY